MLRGVYGNRERFMSNYWSTVKVDGQAVLLLGRRGAARRRTGTSGSMGRIDDVIKVSGHRLGTMEVESALVAHPSVVEAAVVGMPHEIKGTGISAFVTLAPDAEPSERLKTALREHVARESRGDRQARSDPLHDGAAQDTVGQDHAAAAAGCRGGRDGDHAGHDDAGGLQRGGEAAGG
jgi:acyl-coenzyme A synthetase/AMP-(fatty) acid ligase